MESITAFVQNINIGQNSLPSELVKDGWGKLIWSTPICNEIGL